MLGKWCVLAAETRKSCASSYMSLPENLLRVKPLTGEAKASPVFCVPKMLTPSLGQS